MKRITPNLSRCEGLCMQGGRDCSIFSKLQFCSATIQRLNRILKSCLHWNAEMLHLRRLEKDPIAYSQADLLWNKLNVYSFLCCFHFYRLAVSGSFVFLFLLPVCDIGLYVSFRGTCIVPLT